MKLSDVCFQLSSVSSVSIRVLLSRLAMGDSEATSSPCATKRPAEPDSGVGEQEPALKQSKKVNATSIHEEFTRYIFTKGGKEKIGSRCNHCDLEMKDINPTNLKNHVQRKHRDIFDIVIGKIRL